MQLYYLPGSCAIAPHIALEQTGSSYETVRLERGEQSSATYLEINPLGRVPALRTKRDQIICEVPAILNLIADESLDGQLLPSVGSEQRYLALSWLAYFSSTLHPAYGRLWRAERFVSDSACQKSVEDAAHTQIAASHAYIESSIENGDLPVGKTVTAVDCYLFVFGRWGFRLPKSTRQYPNLLRHTRWMSEQPAVGKVLAEQGITLEGPASGPG